MRPEVVVFPFLGSEMGGSHVSAFTLAQSLMADFGIRCVALIPDGTLISREASRLGMEVRPSGERPSGRNNPLYDLVSVPRRTKALRAERDLTLLHCNDIGALQAWGPAAKLCGMPIVYHHRALNRMAPPNTTIVRMADRVICISQECRDAMGFLPASRVSTIVNPFNIALDQDRETARRDLAQDLDLPAGLRLIGFVGNFWRRKRPEFFLDVCARLATRHEDLGFVVFGRDGDLTQAQLASHADRLGISGRTRFAGFRLPVERNIAPLDVLLLTAVREPFGRTAVESLLLGTPYVATADAGHVEIAARWGGGLLVDQPADAEAFAQVVSGVLEGRKSPALSAEERRLKARELSPRGHAEAVLEVYREAMGARPGRGGAADVTG